MVFLINDFTVYTKICVKCKTGNIAADLKSSRRGFFVYSRLFNCLELVWTWSYVTDVITSETLRLSNAHRPHCNHKSFVYPVSWNGKISCKITGVNDDSETQHFSSILIIYVCANSTEQEIPCFSFPSRRTKLDLTGSLYNEINHIKGLIKTWKRLHTYTEYINMNVLSLRAYLTPAPLKGIKWKFEQMTVSLFPAS